MMAMEGIESTNNMEAELLMNKSPKRRCFFHLPENTAGSGGGSRWKMVRAAEIDGRSLRFRSLNQRPQSPETMAAGPRLMTFIRRLNRSKDGRCGGGGEKEGKFRYDPRSYALNFDDGTERIENFAARFAVVPTAVKATLV